MGGLLYREHGSRTPRKEPGLEGGSVQKANFGQARIEKITVIPPPLPPQKNQNNPQKTTPTYTSSSPEPSTAKHNADIMLGGGGFGFIGS